MADDRDADPGRVAEGTDGSDRELRRVHDGYRDQISQLFADIGAALAEMADADDRGATDALQRAYHIAHSVAGTAGTVGYAAAGAIARTMTVALRGALHARRHTRTAVSETDTARAPNTPAGSHGAVDETPLEGTTRSATVLVLDDDPDFLATVQAIGRESLITVRCGRTGRDALEIVRNEPMDAAILDVSLGDSEDAFEIARQLRSVEGNAELPLAFISVDSSLENRVAAAHAGASLFLDKPLSRDDFGNAVRHLVPVDAERRPRLLIVDNDRTFLDATVSVLASERFHIETLTDPTRILEVAAALRPDLVLLDVAMPQISGFEVCRVLRSTERWRDVPVLFLTAHEESEARVLCFRVGGDDYIKKPVDREELVTRIRSRLERIRWHRERADRDALTGVATRRAFIDLLRMRLSEASRQGQPASVAVVDLDHFKAVNDTYGHLAGDRVLARFGRLLATRFRSTDLRGRWGGDEFVVVFYGEETHTARAVLGRLLDEVRGMRFEGDHGERFQTTFSAGIAMYPDDGVSFENVMRAADRRLYAAKAAGRDRIEV